MREHLQSLGETSRGLRLFERSDEVGQGAEVDATAALGRVDGEADGEVGLADAGWAEEDDVFLALDEAELVEALNLLMLDRGLEAEVEVGERLHGGQARGAHGGLQTPIVSERDLGTEQILDGFAGGELAAIDAGEDRIEGLKGARHLEVSEHGADPVAARGFGGLHWAPPATCA